MKTPMQEMIEFIKEKLKEDTLHYNTHPSDGGLIAIRMSQFYLEMAESMLEKEKEVIMQAFLDGCDSLPDDGFPISAKTYYNETFDTKEKFKLNSIPEEEVEKGRSKAYDYKFK